MRGTDHSLCFYYFFIKEVIDIIDDMQVLTALIKQRRIVYDLKNQEEALQNHLKDAQFPLERKDFLKQIFSKKKQLQSAQEVLDRMEKAHNNYINA